MNSLRRKQLNEKSMYSTTVNKNSNAKTSSNKNSNANTSSHSDENNKTFKHNKNDELYQVYASDDPFFSFLKFSQNPYKLVDGVQCGIENTDFLKPSTSKNTGFNELSTLKILERLKIDFCDVSTKEFAEYIDSCESPITVSTPENAKEENNLGDVENAEDLKKVIIQDEKSSTIKENMHERSPTKSAMNFSEDNKMFKDSNRSDTETVTPSRSDSKILIPATSDKDTENSYGKSPRNDTEGLNPSGSNTESVTHSRSDSKTLIPATSDKDTGNSYGNSPRNDTEGLNPSGSNTESVTPSGNNIKHGTSPERDMPHASSPESDVAHEPSDSENEISKSNDSELNSSFFDKPELFYPEMSKTTKANRNLKPYECLSKYRIVPKSFLEEIAEKRPSRSLRKKYGFTNETSEYLCGKKESIPKEHPWYPWILNPLKFPKEISMADKCTSIEKIVEEPMSASQNTFKNLYSPSPSKPSVTIVKINSSLLDRVPKKISTE